MLKLIYRNLLHHPLRSLLTIGSLIVAMFTICILRSVVTTLGAGLEGARADRLIVQSAVSLFVDLPLSYQQEIADVDGIEKVCKWQWFGGYYQDPSNFFAQFAVDMDVMLDVYDTDLKLTSGTPEGLLGNQVGCLIGSGLAQDFGWKVGDTIPLIGALFPRPGGEAWTFRVEAIYEPTKPNFDARTMFFHWKYLEEGLKEIFDEPPGVGTFVLRLSDPNAATQVMAEVDALFENGPQRVQTTSEAEFQRQFISMLGNIPRFLGAIGGGVLLAILLACVNTMLMAGREQEQSIGILKALGFTDSSMLGLMVGQSMLLCSLGGGAGIGLALLMEAGIAQAIQANFPGFKIASSTLLLAASATLIVGLIAGAVPAWNASRKRCVDALRAGA